MLMSAEQACVSVVDSRDDPETVTTFATICPFPEKSIWQAIWV
jgi:hypothetical protein